MPATDTPSHPPQIEPALRAIAMPADANPNGDIFGGWLLAQMDLAGGTAASQRSKGRVVTIAITGMTFRLPVFVGGRSRGRLPARALFVGVQDARQDAVEIIDERGGELLETLDQWRRVHVSLVVRSDFPFDQLLLFHQHFLQIENAGLAGDAEFTCLGPGRTAGGTARYDNYGGRWGEQRHLERLTQIYAVEKAKIEARRRGHAASERTLEDGSILVTVEVGH